MDRLLRRFGLWKLRQRKILELSYGQRRLALIARAFAAQPRVLLLDEPFNGLDDHRRKVLKEALQQRTHAGMSWVITSHRLNELPANVTHVAHIVAGRLVETRQLRKGERLQPSGARGLAGSRESFEPKHGLHSPEVGSEDPVRRAARAGTVQAPMISLRNVSLYREYRPVIVRLNWTVQPGEHWAIMGANGSGKSTLLMSLYGDVHPALGGAIERSGFPRHTPIERWKVAVGFVSPELQADHYLSRSIEEVVISGRYASVGLNAPADAEARRLAARWLKFFGLQKLRSRGPREVSYGQMRLALVARAMMAAPRLLLLDEPCTGLDQQVRGELLQLIEKLARGGTQVVMAVHDKADLVPAIRRVLRLERGGRVRQLQR